MIEVEVAFPRLTNSSEEPDAEFGQTVVSHYTLSAPLPVREVPLVPETEEGFARFRDLATALVGVSKEELAAAEETLRALREEGDSLRARHGDTQDTDQQ